MTTSSLHLELLDNKRKDIFAKIPSFAKDFVLGGGTAISLFLGKRISYDFDLFSTRPIAQSLLKKVSKILPNCHPIIDNVDELTILTQDKIYLRFIVLANIIALSCLFY